MTRTGDTANILMTYISKQLASQGSSLALDTLLFEEGHLDSTAMLDMILWIGDTFGIAIENAELTPEHFATPRNIVDFVEAKMGCATDAQTTSVGEN